MSKKVIRQFRVEEHGLFIDLADRPASVAVHTSTGILQLNEGKGADRFSGAAIAPGNSPAIEVQTSSNGLADVRLLAGGMAHSLGQSTSPLEAMRWAEVANRVLRRFSPSAEVVGRGFAFRHPDRGEDPRAFAERLIREELGEEHVADLDWANCIIVDD